MFQSVSAGGTSLDEKQEKVARKKERFRKRGPFKYFVAVSGVLILVMWGVILFGGKAPPTRNAEFSKKGRVLLFMVHGALKRYAHYEGRRYPERLSDLAPKYLSLGKSELHLLDKLSYETDPGMGYRLSLTSPDRGGMTVVLSAKGIHQIPPVQGRGK
jgi:hypothetical protein